MSAPKQVRWVCPNCGKGRLAPSRPRKDDVRRYCLPCSEKTGRLVERQAPSLERKREESRARAAEKAARERRAKAAKERRARERAEERNRVAGERATAETIARRTVVGFDGKPLDLLVEAERLWRLPFLSSIHGGRPLPPIDFRRSLSKTHSSGVCYHAAPRRIVVTIGWAGADRWPELADRASADVRATLLHELVHAALPYGVHHDDRFWTVLRSAARESWPEAPFRFATPAFRKWEKQEQIRVGIRALYLLAVSGRAADGARTIGE